MIYVFNSAAIILAGILLSESRYSDRNKKAVFLVITTLVMSLIIGLRFEVGADYSSYEQLYHDVGEGISTFSTGRLEIGYRIFTWILWQFGIPYWGLNLIMASLTNIFIALSIYRMCESFRETVIAAYSYVCFFFFYFSMNQTRQGLAMAVCLFAVTFLVKGKRLIYLLIVALMLSFHLVTAVMFLPLVFLVKIRANHKTLIAYAGMAVLVVLGSGVLRNVLARTRYGLYFEEGYDQYFMAGSTSVGLTTTQLNLIVRLILLVIVLVLARKVTDGLDKNVLYHMVILCTIVQTAAVQIVQLSRTTTPLFLAYVILLPKCLEGLEFENKKIMVLAAIAMETLYQAVYFYFMWRSVLVNGYSCVLFQ